MRSRKNRQMPVRRKIFVVMAAISALVFLAVFALSRIILEPGSNANEVLRVSDNNLRVRGAVRREIAEIGREAKDFASRADTLRLIRDPDLFTGRNRTAEGARLGNAFDVLICADRTGRILASRAFDRREKAARPVPPDLLKMVAPSGPLLRKEEETDGRAGLIVLPEGPCLLASYPVLTAQDAGLERGTFVFARVFDAEAVSRLADVTHIPLRAVSPDDPSVPVPASDDPSANPDQVRILDRNRISGFVPIADLEGRPALVLTFDLPRTFHRQFLGALWYFLGALLLYTCLSLGFGQKLMDQLVTSRLIHLTDFMKDVESSGALESRLMISGKDEVARLASGLNNMLAALGRHVDGIKAAEDAVKRSEAKYRALFDAATDAIFLETQDGRILDCNPMAAKLFDKPKNDLIGLPFMSLFDRGRAADHDRLLEELESRGFLFVERTGRKTSGEKFPCEVSVRAAQIGRSNLIVAFVHDTTERAQSEEELRRSLREKEVLLREVHHRVKNNMQIISSLFNLQTPSIRDPSAIILLRECQVRIRSMALVHEKLYQSKDMAHIHFADYLRSLAMYLFHFWQVNEERIRLDMRIANILLDVNTAIPLGLIVNELLSNCIEHAFPDGRVGEIRVRLIALDPGQFELIVEDDGIGLPQGFDISGSETLGLQLVCLLVKQLDGTVTAASKGGTRIRILANALQYKQRF